MPDTLNPRIHEGANNPPASRAVLDDLRLYLAEDDATLTELARRIVDALPSAISEQIAPLQATTTDLQTIMDRWDTERPEIADDDQAEKAANFVRKIKAQEKAIGDWHKGGKEPFLNAGRIVDATKTKLLASVEKMTDGMMRRIGRYQARLEVARKAEAERLRKEAEDQERQAREAAAEGNTAEAAALEAYSEQSSREAHRLATGPVQVRSDHGALATQRKTWKHQVTDAAKVPRAYCSPDADLIKAAIKATADPSKLEIKGVCIFEETTTLVR